MPWTIVNLLVTFVAFGLLARVSPCNPQQPRFVTRELADNALYWMVGLVLAVGVYSDLSALIVRTGAAVVFGGDAAAVARATREGWGWMSRLPLLVQAVIVVVVLDIIQYWLHRVFHADALWPFHAVHHSAVEVDWSTAYRFHPVNFVVYSTGAYALVACLGFSPMAFVIIGPFNIVMGSVVHANVNWTYGPFRYVLASPVFHRWHHAKDPAVRDKNFAPTFPVLDLIFGTYYMPKGVLPSDYGCDDAPLHFTSQMIRPFLVYAERFGLKPRAGQAPA